MLTTLRLNMLRDELTVDVLLDGLVGQDGTTVDVDFITNGDIVTENSDVLKTSPLANGAVPANDGRLDPGVVLDAAVLQQHTALETDTIANDNVGANCDVGANAAVLANLCGLVDHDVTTVDVRLVRRDEELGVLALQRGEVQACARQEVLGLSDIHPEALEVEGVQTAILNNGREGLLLNGSGAELDALENAGVQDVDTGVDAVANEFDRLLDETINFRRVAGLVDNDTVLGRFLNLCDNDCALITVLLVELGELGEGVFAGNVGVEDEERRVVLSEDGLSELEGTGGAKGLGLDGKCNLDVVQLLVLHLRVNCESSSKGVFSGY